MGNSAEKNSERRKPLQDPNVGASTEKILKRLKKENRKKGRRGKAMCLTQVNR